MDDRQIWEQGISSITSLFAALTPAKQQQMTELLTSYCQAKESLVAITLAVDSETTCRACAGQCCLNGKYRMNIFDILAHCAADISLSPDFEQKPLCPYGTAQGCTMEPGFRPVDCVLFICDTLDRHLTDFARSCLVERESAIRGFLLTASRLIEVPLGIPLLLWAENRTN